MTQRRRVSRSSSFALLAIFTLISLAYFPLSHTRAASITATVLPSAGKPLVNLKNAQSLKVTYAGSSDAVKALQSGSAIATALASADFDADGAIDVVAGYSTGNGGVVALYRGNKDAFSPTNPALYPKAIKGSIAPTFLSKAQAFSVPGSPDLLATGDFNRDGFQDVLVGTKGSNLYLLAGDGTGNLQPAQIVPLTGQVRALAVLPDGHVAVSLDNPNGSDLAILSPSTAGLIAGASFPLPASGDSVAWGNLGGGADIAVGAGKNIALIYNALSTKPQTETVTVPFQVMGLALGDFVWDQDGRTEISVLADDGSVQILQHGVLNTAPLTAAQIPARRKAYSPKAAHQPSNPTALGTWTVAKQLPYTGSAPASPVSASAFSSPHVAQSSTHDVMVLDAARNQLNILDTSGKTASPSAAVSFSGTPVAALVTRQKIDAARDIVVLTSAQSAPMSIAVPGTFTFNVNNTADVDAVNACATNSTVTTPPSTLHLREAVCIANNNGASTVTINVPAGTYSLSLSTTGGDDSASSSPELQVGIQSGNNITISGAGAGSTIIQQTVAGSRIIEADQNLQGTMPLAIQNLTLQNGDCTDSGLDCTNNGGGAILAGGVTGDTLTLTNVDFNHNSATSSAGALGGAVTYTGSLLSVTGSTFSSNTASGTGGAEGGGVQVANEVNGNGVSGAVTITNSTFTGNSASGGNDTDANGGGLFFTGSGGFNGTVTGSTFTGNTASASGSTGAATGGGINAEGGGTDSFTVSNSRIVGNNVSASSANGSGYYGVGLVNTVTNDWWGCNSGPGASGCDTVVFDLADGGSGTFSPWLVLSISASPTQINPNGTSQLTADLTHDSSGTGGFSVPNGTPVTFGGTLDSSVNPTSSTLTSGQATSTYTAGSTPGAGSGTASVDNQNVSVTINIKANTSTTVAVYDAGTDSPWSNTEVAGASSYANSTVLPAGTGGPAPTGSVTYNIFSNNSCSGNPLATSVETLVSGTVPSSSTSAPLAAGIYSFQASYSGDNDYNSSSSSCAFFVVSKATPSTSVSSSVNPSMFGQPVTLTATLNGPYFTSGTMNFTSNGTTIGGCSAVFVSSGTAQCTTSALPLGTDTIVANYSGDANNNGSTGTLAGGQQVNPVAASTTTTVSSSLNPSFTTAPGNSVTFAATVTSNSSTVNEGTVTFSDAANDFTCSGGNTVPVSNGQATCTTSFTTEGARNISAAYSGTVNFQSSSGNITQVANNHTVVNGNQFCNQGAISIPSTAGAATPYPSNIFVTGLSGNVGAVTVNLNNISSSNIEQTDLLLVGPTGAQIIPFASVGDSSSISGVNVTLDDSASGLIPGGPLTTGTYKPTSTTGSTNLVFPPPAPITNAANYAATDGAATLTSTFQNTAPNGTWALYAMDNAGNGAASIGGGWCVNITPPTVQTTITTSPAGLLVSVDGGTATAAPLVENWVPGSSHTIATTSPQPGATGVQYVFSSWSDSGSISHSITVQPTATTYTANFTTQYQLTTQASPPADGTVTPASGGYYASGAIIPVTATANSGFTFSNWTSTGGSFTSTTSASTNFTMPAAPATVTGDFGNSSVQITITTSPANLLVSVDGGSATAAPLVESWIPGSSHIIATSSPQSGGAGVQYVWSNWSDSGAISHNITVPPSATTYTASFATQYQLTTAAHPSNGGSVSPASGGFYNSGTIVPLSATPNAGFTFKNWTGNVANANSASTSITMTAPQSVTANFATSPQISINPTSINFGTVYLFNIKEQNVTIKNTGTSNVGITNVSLTLGSSTNKGDYTFVSGCPAMLTPGKSCIIGVFFFAGNIGTPSATLNITDNASGSPQHVNLSATVINPIPGFKPPVLNLPTTKVGRFCTEDVVLTNVGTTTLDLNSIKITGPNASNFKETNSCPATLAPNASCSIAVTFTPTRTGAAQADLTVTDNAEIGTQNVLLTGKGD